MPCFIVEVAFEIFVARGLPSPSLKASAVALGSMQFFLTFKESSITPPLHHTRKTTLVVSSDAVNVPRPSIDASTPTSKAYAFYEAL